MRHLRLTIALMLALGLTGCFQDTKADILKKAEGATTKTELRAVLGEPDDLNKAGPLEEWIYNASDGTVSFALVGEKVGGAMTGSK